MWAELAQTCERADGAFRKSSGHPGAKHAVARKQRRPAMVPAVTSDSQFHPSSFILHPSAERLPLGISKGRHKGMGHSG